MDRRSPDREVDALWHSYVDEVDPSADDVAAADRMLDEILTGPTTDAT